MEIEVNGVKYQQKEQPKRKPMNKTMSSMLVMAYAFAYLDPYRKKPKETPNVDIIKEYGLIQNKKSNLPKSQRDWVIWQFERNFVEIVNPKNLKNN